MRRIEGAIRSLSDVEGREPEQVRALFDQVWSARGRLDLLVNSAGGQFPQAAIDFSVKGWNAVINTNLNGTWHMMQAAARRWRDAKRPGSIVNIVVVTTHGLYGVAHTIAARAGVIGLSKAVAVEWAPLGVRVNCIAPGAIETEGERKLMSREESDTFMAVQSLKRRIGPLDVARVCLFLSSELSDAMTGQTLNVDGGWIMY